MAKWTHVDELFNVVPEITKQYKAMLCIKNTGIAYYGVITVFDRNTVKYASLENDKLYMSDYIPTHFILIDDIPFDENAVNLISQQD